jgi:hypothetical protein
MGKPHPRAVGLVLALGASLSPPLGALNGAK